MPNTCLLPGVVSLITCSGMMDVRLVGDNTKFETVATYSNGDAMAIIQNRIGLIGCHPEAEQFWYDDYSWMRKHWAGGHHRLQLVEFVDQLMQS
jgi:hypothetical protein